MPGYPDAPAAATADRGTAPAIVGAPSMSDTAQNADPHAEGWRVSSGTRVLIAFGAGILAFALAFVFTSWQAAALIGWNVTSAFFLAAVWIRIAGKDGPSTARLATAEDPSRVTADLLLIVASGASLIGVALALLEASDQEGIVKAFTTGVAGLALVLSWTTVNTVFTLRYADLYYRAEGGIDFHDDPEPDFGDFAYLAFTIGMTYQVSDTTLTTKPIRRTALRHALLSFVFVTSVVAMTINVVASLFLR
jgi:uncharacterized membrane protein